MAEDPTVIFIIGGPGSGKGTQCTLLSKEYGFRHFSAGDLLRAERRSGSEQATVINDIIKRGDIVPSEITVGLLKKAIGETTDTNKFLIDGFPRNVEQGEMFENGICESKRVIFFDCDDEVMEKRLLARAAAAKARGEELRDDDHPDVIKRRLKTNREICNPVVQHYKKNYDKLIVINADQEIADIFNELKSIVDKL